ncbi:MAG TPA: transcriptional regulator [Candidatus Omnitrophica bacterium]|nr:transcriptional regulator [Candidatus Omnitrophota bacterium]
MQINNLALKTILFRKSIKQWQLAKMVGIHETNLSKIMIGRLEPSEKLVDKICKALKIKKSDLAIGIK